VLHHLHLRHFDRLVVGDRRHHQMNPLAVFKTHAAVTLHGTEV